MSHTSKPWYRRSRSDGGFEVLTQHEDLLVCLVQGTVGTADQFNSRLIAAAPDLLEACKDLRRLLFEIAGGPLDQAAKFGPDWEPPDAEECGRRAAKADAAIAKAESPKGE